MSNLISITGHLCNDYIITVDEYPPVGESRRVVNRETFFGGGAANIAVGIATLGGESELISAVGKDFPGSPYERHLQELGIKTTFFTSEKNCSTAFMVNTTAGEQITYFEWGAGEVFSKASAPKREFVHMATGDAEFNIKVAKNADFASLDPGQDVKYYSKEELEELFGNIDILICNIFELNIMKETLGYSSSDIFKAVPMAIITEGKKGSTIHADSGKTQISSCVVDAMDPTGAGDAYRAGLFTAWKRGYDIETCCKVGAVVSSFAVEKIGTQTNLPNWEMMEDRYRTFFKGGLS
ncbi:MAG TPA: carbohydrate kinase family protein [Methanocorpusculum sp.]|nr:carbohydrate kinase family protein [Methanocorpusculum sp.]